MGCWRQHHQFQRLSKLWPCFQGFDCWKSHLQIVPNVVYFESSYFLVKSTCTTAQFLIMDWIPLSEWNEHYQHAISFLWEQNVFFWNQSVNWIHSVLAIYSHNFALWKDTFIDVFGRVIQLFWSFCLQVSLESQTWTRFILNYAMKTFFSLVEHVGRIEVSTWILTCIVFCIVTNLILLTVILYQKKSMVELNQQWRHFQSEFMKNQSCLKSDVFSSAPPPPPPLPLVNPPASFKRPTPKSKVVNSRRESQESSNASSGVTDLFSNLMQELSTAKLKSGVMDLMNTPRRKYQELKNKAFGSCEKPHDSQDKENTVVHESTIKYGLPPPSSTQKSGVLTRNQKRNLKIHEAGQIQKEKITGSFLPKVTSPLRSSFTLVEREIKKGVVLQKTNIPMSPGGTFLFGKKEYEPTTLTDQVIFSLKNKFARAYAG